MAERSTSLLILLISSVLLVPPAVLAFFYAQTSWFFIISAVLVSLITTGAVIIFMDYIVALLWPTEKTLFAAAKHIIKMSSLERYTHTEIGYIFFLYYLNFFTMLYVVFVNGLPYLAVLSFILQVSAFLLTFSHYYSFKKFLKNEAEKLRDRDG